LIYDPSRVVAAPMASSGTSRVMAAVPEPGTLALLLAFWSAAIYCRFRFKG
jgi:hypothetical protein